MKANEAPEKIYLQDSMSTDTIGDLWPEWFDAKVSDDSIEYVRKDVFIEKAWEWVEDNMLSSNQQDKSRLYYEQFKNYMKGE